jgi:predicted regulator of Ras-like GTPase activity (Roadblock/LC7/MglB family)
VNDLEEILTHLVTQVDGATAAFVASSDGLLIEQHPRQGQDFSAVAAQWTNVLVALGNVGSGLKAGTIRETTVTTDQIMAYVRLVNKELFCVVLLSPVGDIDKARELSQQVSENLLEVFA